MIPPLLHYRGSQYGDRALLNGYWKNCSCSPMEGPSPRYEHPPGKVLNRVEIPSQLPITHSNPTEMTEEWELGHDLPTMIHVATRQQILF